ncbi:MAG: carbohydrate ABC transporter permease [Nitrososphaeria archaeon]
MAIIILFPIVIIFFSSLKPEEEIYSVPPRLLPNILTLEHYLNLFTLFNFKEFSINSLIIASFTALFSTLFGTLSAYGFSRFKFKFADKILFFIMIIRTFTPVALLFPLYLVIRSFGLLDTTLAIVLGVTSLQIPFTIWFMKTFFDEFPKSIEEAAMLDGVSDLGVLWKIVIPLSRPAIAVSIIFAFLAGWGDFIFSLSFSQTPRSMPLTIGIANMLTGYKIYWGELMAGGTYMMLIPLIIVIFFQKYLVKGLIAGAIKA